MLMASMPSAASVAARRSGPSLRRLQPGRVDEPHVGVERGSVGRAAARPRGTATAGGAASAPARATTAMTARADVGVLEVERQVVVGAAPLEQIGERRDVLGQLCARTSIEPIAVAPAGPHDAVVVEHGDTVGGQPDVALQPVAPSRRAEREGLERVLPGVGAGARWAKAIGRSSSDGSRCCTRIADRWQGRRWPVTPSTRRRPASGVASLVDCAGVQPVRQRDHRDPAAGAGRARPGEAP